MMKNTGVLNCLLLFFLTSGSSFSISDRDDYFGQDANGQCGYASCQKTKDGFINVHLIPHTHDDVGWLKTVDQYFFGSKSNKQLAGVQYILDSVIQELKHDPNKRFIYVETAFFWKWWERQNDHTRHLVQRLVRNGQLEFIGGAWSMHDEATTHYQSLVDEFTWGFRKLNDTFGKCGVPRIGWQIDPFGHSRETASIMARLGFDALFFGRLDYVDKTVREVNKRMEFVWEGSPNLGKEADLFSGALFNTYSAPSGFCFDILCGDEPIIDDVNSPDYNAERKAVQFLKHVIKQANSYKPNNDVAITMGGDFTYQDAHMYFALDFIAEIWKRSLAYKGTNIAVAMGDDFQYQAAQKYFVNTDRLINAVNKRQKTHNSKIHLIYSTPSCYAKALNEEGHQWPTKQDDFFPYASDPHAFWTGYFSSRPAIKRFERMGNNFLQVCKQLYSLANLDAGEKRLNLMREVMGVMQHHDAVSGTEQQHVASDYARQLNNGFEQCGSLTENALNKLMAKTPTSAPLALENCMMLNISQCEVSENSNSFVVTLYNPLSRKVSRYVRLPVSGDKTYNVYDPTGEAVPTQVVPVPDAVTKIPGRFSQASVEVVFRAVDLPPLGYRSYLVAPSNSVVASHPSPQRLKNRLFTMGFSNSPKITFDKKKGLPIKLDMPGVSDPPSFQQNFYYYESAVGNNAVFENRSSGAYIFRPNSSLIIVNPQPSVKYYKGPLVEEVHQVFSSWVSQVIRAYEGEDNMEFEWLVGPIPIRDKIGKEIVTRFNIYNMATNLTFYTDSNGREMLERVKDYRPTFNVTLQEPVAGNYYPVTTRISLKDDTNQFSVITDRAQGGSSLEDGEIELMVHRRCLHDDAFGVGEALNETAYGTGLVVRGTHYLTGGSVVNQSAADRRLVQQRVLDAWTFFTPTDLSLAQWQDQYNMEYSGLHAALPDNVQILTLEPWKGSSFLLRLEHILEKDDDSSASQPVTVNLQDIFKPFSITWVRETSLGGNQWLDEVSRLVWKKDNNLVDNNETPSETKPQDLPTVKLTPMAIKTFIIEVLFKQ